MTQNSNLQRVKRNYAMDVVERDYGDFFHQSRKAFLAANEHLPAGNSRTSACYAPFPLYMDRAKGHYLREIGGHELMDFSLNYGTTILGHQAPVIRKAMDEAFEVGLSHCAPVMAEQTLAGIIRERLPAIEMIRFTSSGTEAATMALRAARAYRRRRWVLKLVGVYHGSSLVGKESYGFEKGKFSPEAEVIALPHDDPARLSAFFQEYGSDLAATICEPVLGAGGLIPIQRDILQLIEKYSRQQGWVFILDEVMMFRLGYHGAQGVMQITPDLTILGKMIGGGLPVGAFGGRREIMKLFDSRREDALSHAGTYNGNTATMMAGIACLNRLDPAAFTSLKDLTTHFVEKGNALLKKHDLPARFRQCESFFALHCLPEGADSHDQWLQQDRQLFKCLFLGLLRAGVMLTPSGLGSTALTMQGPDIDRAIAALESTLQRYLV